MDVRSLGLREDVRNSRGWATVALSVPALAGNTAVVVQSGGFNSSSIGQVGRVNTAGTAVKSLRAERSMKVELERLRCRAEMVSAHPVRTGGMAGHRGLELRCAERISASLASRQAADFARQIGWPMGV